jgi:WD40 repeat protein
MAVLKRVSEETPRPVCEVNPEIPAWLGAIIAKLHAKSPAERYQSAAEVADLLSAHLARVQQSGQRAAESRTDLTQQLPRNGSRARRLAAGAALVLCGGLLAYGLAAMMRDGSRDTPPAVLQRPSDGSMPRPTESQSKSVTASTVPIPQPTAKTNPSVPVAPPLVKDGAFRSVAWAPQGPYLAAALNTGPESSVCIFDTRSWACIQRLPAVSAVSASWNPGGDRLAVGSGNGTVQVWGLDGTLITTFKERLRNLQVLAWSPDGKFLATGEVDGMVRLWSPDGTPGPVLRGHKGAVRTLAWSPDSKHLATGGYDRALRLWAADGRELHTLLLDQTVVAIAWDRAGTELAVCLGSFSIQILGLDGKTRQQFSYNSNLGLTIAWEPNDKFLAVGDNGGKVQLFTPEGKPGPVLVGDKSIISTAWSPDGKLLAAGTGTAKVYLWSAAGAPIKILHAPASVEKQLPKP